MDRNISNVRNLKEKGGDEGREEQTGTGGIFQHHTQEENNEKEEEKNKQTAFQTGNYCEEVDWLV